MKGTNLVTAAIDREQRFSSCHLLLAVEGAMHLSTRLPYRDTTMKQDGAYRGFREITVPEQ